MPSNGHSCFAFGFCKKLHAFSNRNLLVSVDILLVWVGILLTKKHTYFSKTSCDFLSHLLKSVAICWMCRHLVHGFHNPSILGYCGPSTAILWPQQRNAVVSAKKFFGSSKGMLWSQQRNTVVPAMEFCGPSKGMVWSQQRNAVVPAEEYCCPSRAMLWSQQSNTLVPAAE